MHHRIIRRGKGNLVDQLAVGGNFVEHAISGAQTGGRVTKRDHVARLGVDLGVGRKGVAAHLALELGEAVGLHRCGVHYQSGGVFLQRIKLTAVDEGVGVGGAAIFASHRRVIRQRVAVGPEQRLARLILQLPLVGLGPALAEIALAVMKVEAGNHPVAIEADVIGEPRRELRIGLDAEEGTVQFGRNSSLMDQIGNIGLNPAGRVKAGEAHRIGKIGHAESALDSDCMLH